MIVVPKQFAQWRAQVDGAAGREWVRSLPARVERLCDLWDLSVDDAEPLHGGLSLVVLVHRGDQPLALRLSRPDETSENEVTALRAWDGRGMVRLLAAELDAGALLLERLDHSRSLHTLPLWEAAEVAGSLIRTLAVTPPPGLPRLSEVAAGVRDGLPRRQRALGDPIPPGWLRAAVRHADELKDAGEQVLIHADLHYGNVLVSTRLPWIAVDPRPLQGAPEYSLPELMWTRADELNTGAETRRLLRSLAGAGGLDADVAYGWVIARCVDYWLWGLERSLTLDPVRCERVLTALLPRP
jgi:streptomycin 6-kinase